MKKTLFVALALVLVAMMLAGCGGAPAANNEAPTTESEAPAPQSEAPATENEAPATESEAPATESEAPAGGGSAADFNIGILVKTMNNPYFVDLSGKVEEFCKAEGFNVVGNLNADQDLAEELRLMEQYVGQQVDLILWNPIDPQGSIAAADLAADAGIPLVGIDNLCQSDRMTTTVYSDNKTNGFMVGKFYAENYLQGETIQSILISGEKGNAVGDERRTGLMAGIISVRAGVDEATAWAEADAMEQKLTDEGKVYHEASDFHILGQGFGNWTAEEGLPAAEDLLTANSDVLNTLMGENDAMLLGAMTAVENQNLTDKIWIIAAADGQKEAYEMIGTEGSKYLATGLNAPPVIARGAVDIAIDILLNGVDPASYELTTTTPPAAITATNVADFYDPAANF